MAESEITEPKEYIVGTSKVGNILQKLGVEVSTWKKTTSGVDWDKAVWATDTIKKGNDALELIRNGITYEIALLKKEITFEKKNNTPTMRKEIKVVSGDNISKILAIVFGKGNFSYGDRNGLTNMKAGWDKISIGDKLTLETDGKPDKDNVYLYTLSRSNNEKIETITFVSSKQLMQSNSVSVDETSSEAPAQTMQSVTSPTADIGKPSRAAHKALEGKGIKTIEGVKSPTIVNLGNIFPDARLASLNDLHSGKEVKIGNSNYQLAKLDGNIAVIGKERFPFTAGVNPEPTDIIVVVTNQDGSKVAVAHQILKSGKYSRR